jgi:hypothetical protein
MLTAGILAVVALGAIGTWTGRKVVHGVKKAAHQAVCIVGHGHKCPTGKIQKKH